MTFKSRATVWCLLVFDILTIDDVTWTSTAVKHRQTSAVDVREFGRQRDVLRLALMY